MKLLSPLFQLAFMSLVLVSVLADPTTLHAQRKVNWESEIGVGTVSKSAVVPSDLAGPIVLLFETQSGFAGNEYYIQLRDESNNVLASTGGPHANEASGDTGKVSKPQSGDYWYAIVCPSASCSGTIVLTAIECGCDDDTPWLFTECTFDSRDSASPALCTLGFSANTILGSWEWSGRSGPGISFELTLGTSNSMSEAMGSSHTTSVSNSIDAGFTFLDFFNVGVGVEETYTNQAQQSFETTVVEGIEFTTTVMCGSSDRNWFPFIWKFAQDQDAYGLGFTSLTLNVVCTYSSLMKPRCPLGYCDPDDKLCQTCVDPFEHLSAATDMPTQAPVAGGPTPAPNPAPSGGGSACFAPTTTVQVKDVGAVTLEELAVGSHVLSADTNQYETVYAMGHYDTKAPTEYLQIAFGSNRDIGAKLEVSGSHFVYVQGQRHPVRADSLAVGDILEGSGDHYQREITSIGKVIRNGRMTPLTTSGKVVVNGNIQASSYVDYQEEAKTLFGSEYVNFWSHICVAPFRFYCSHVRGDYCTTYSEEGIPLGLKMWKGWADRAIDEPILQKGFLLAGFFTLALLFWTLECLVMMMPALFHAAVALTLLILGLKAAMTLRVHL